MIRMMALTTDGLKRFFPAALSNLPTRNGELIAGLRGVPVLVFVLFLSLSPVATAQDSGTQPTQAAPPANPFKGTYLFGDWGGSRVKMAKYGVNFDAIFTQFGQGFSEQDQDVSNYANKFDLYLNVDTAKAHLWRGGGIGAHMEIRYGNAATGLHLFPTNTALYSPSTGPNHPVLTSLYLTQKIGETSSLIFGKINTIDLLAASPFLGGRGLDGFMHIAFAAPPSGVTPVSTYGVIAKTQIKKAGFTFFVFDPKNQTASNTQPFKEGVNFNVTAALPTRSFGHNATHSFSGTFSTQSKTDLDDLPQLLLPPENRQIGTRRGPFCIYYQYEQYLHQDIKNPAEGWGLFARVGIADGNPNTLQNLFLAGLGGTGLIGGRKLDRFGVGYFRYGISNALKNALIAPPVLLRINNESGAEIFYNYAVTRSFRLTADLQILPPTIATKDTTLVFGALRAKISF